MNKESIKRKVCNHVGDIIDVSYTEVEKGIELKTKWGVFHGLSYRNSEKCSCYMHALRQLKKELS